MRNLSRAPRLYELMTILTPEVPEEELPGSIDRIASYITEAGGAVNETLRDSPWGRRRLAYPIRHSGRDVRDGYYTVFHFELDPAKIDDVERELRLNDRVIRHLMTHFTPVPIDESTDAESSGEAVTATVETVPAPADEAAPAVETATDEAPIPEEEPIAQASAATEEPVTNEEAVEVAAVETAEDSQSTEETAAEQPAAADETVEPDEESDER
ncbi:MAG: 30S ribosomal protein S6 [Thermomicrobiales bacterium]